MRRVVIGGRIRQEQLIEGRTHMYAGGKGVGVKVQAAGVMVMRVTRRNGGR